MSEKISTYHEKYMRRCFQLAKLGEGFVAPNPMVGAVLVYEDRIIGEGYHQQYGKAHAEVNCLDSVKEEDKPFISSSTLYVSLEPCAHFGKTPPCADLIILNKIPKVIISVQDNFEQVNGKGIQRLKENNVEVITGVLENEGKELLKHFLYFNEKKRPYVSLKFAQSKDGYLGIENQQVQISNELSKRYVHKLRAQHQGILVGKNTVITDNPALTVRYWNGNNPVRIILANEADIPKGNHVFNNEAETIFLSMVDSQWLTVNDILQEISKRNIISVLVEGGSNILQQFIDANLWNEAHIITSNKIIDEPLAIDHRPHFIKAPIITGIQQDSILLENNTIQIIKNPNALLNS